MTIYGDLAIQTPFNLILPSLGRDNLRDPKTIEWLKYLLAQPNLKKSHLSIFFHSFFYCRKMQNQTEAFKQAFTNLNHLSQEMVARGQSLILHSVALYDIPDDLPGEDLGFLRQSSIEQLYLSNVKVTHAIVNATAKQLHHLECLDLDCHDDLSNKHLLMLFNSLKGAPKLKSLRLSNFKEKLNPETIQAITHLPLNDLNFKFSQFSPQNLKQLVDLAANNPEQQAFKANLENLNIIGGTLIDNDIAQLAIFSNLNDLNLRDNRELTKDCLPALLQLPKLKKFICYGTKISKEDIQNFSEQAKAKGLKINI